MKHFNLFFALSLFLSLSHMQTAVGDAGKTGDVLSLLIPSIAIGGTVFYEKDREGTVEFLKAFGSTQLLTEVLKTTIRKQRPNGSCCDSFPSGHSARAFSGASFIHKRYGFKYSVPAYIAASYVGYSRVDVDKHRTEDIVAGALVGILSSYFFVRPHRKTQVTAIAQRGVYGLSIRQRF